ncbi:MAG TPA: class I SAM-dependent methyltransferase [Pyrinomonadaceae bacterium]|nr:class I SAM-dependent methyltransferase [Pyrinomonadaceae bacterium]
METVERFSNRVENYIKYRPGYPPQVLQLFRDEMHLMPSSVLADIGSGTGVSARLFLENGNIVYGVEPNAQMRNAATRLLKNFQNYKPIDGTAEYTTLPDGSVNIVFAAQAFHWFEPEKTRIEFKRITCEGGYVALIWNERQLDTTPFLREYEHFLLANASDYQKVRHENVTAEKLEDFFQTDFKKRTFGNEQIFDFEGLRGRMLSSSYMPSESDGRFAEVESNLRKLFEKHAGPSGKVAILYDTNVFYTQI